MTIDEKLVRHIAYLARIGVSDAEMEKFARELGAIVAYVEKLSEVDVSSVEPIAHITGRTNAWRDDVPAGEGGSLVPELKDDFLEEQAPWHVEGEIRVPRVLQ
jgi:aspartyl-tRNA(Asn)/glutamyl-tRNA(Gln) amidotransferase subunit C